MTRLNKIMNRVVTLKGPIKVSVDFGTGSGLVAVNHKWNTPEVHKYAIEEYRRPECVLDETWTFVDSLDEVQETIDVITFTDVLEHFEKEDGFLFLDKVESLARNVVIFVPRGFMKQDVETHPEICRDNPLQIHRSGWEPEEFEARGYQTFIAHEFHKKPQGLDRPFDAVIAWLAR